MRTFFSTIAVIACTILVGDAARILAVFPFQAKSHYNVYEPWLKRLAERGHEVVSVTHFPQRNHLANFTDVDISSTLPSLISSMPFSVIHNFTVWSNIRYLMRHAGVEICEPVLNSPEVRRMIEVKERFDVLIVEIFATECFLGLSHTLKIPIVVGAITSIALPWSNDILRNPENPSYIPNWFSGYTDEMSFTERAVNSLALLVTKAAYRILSDWPSQAIARRYLGEDLPDFEVLRSRISLILTNGHPAVGTARALAPGVKEIGGIHIPISGPPQLPKDLQVYLDAQSAKGVIYFSLGSQIDPSTIPSQVFAALYRAFEQVPQQILWKCSEEKMPPLPGNVKCIEWAPQLAVLCHPSVQLFITHAGLLGLQEAVFCGVPILGMPLFGDQYLNMAYFLKTGMALQLDIRRLSYEGVSSSLNELLTNKSYTDMARRASARFKDRPMPAVNEAAYWLEYLIHHGPAALKTAAADLTWYQYLLLDVVSAIIGILALAAWMTTKCLKLMFRRAERGIDLAKKRN
ncbi:hypothetical protein KM043_002259 [Ampulex compressa]|nr:hypothetical protein KM043_002259 [Ampulex compressa]